MSDDIISLDKYRQQRAQAAQEGLRRWHAEATGEDSSTLEIRNGETVCEQWLFDRKSLDQLIRMLGDVRWDMQRWNIKPCPVCSDRPCYRWHEGQIVQRNGHGPTYRYEGKTGGGRYRLRNMANGSLKYTNDGRRSWWHIIGWELLVTPPAD